MAIPGRETSETLWLRKRRCQKRFTQTQNQRPTVTYEGKAYPNPSEHYSLQVETKGTSLMLGLRKCGPNAVKRATYSTTKH